MSDAPRMSVASGRAGLGRSEQLSRDLEASRAPSLSVLIPTLGDRPEMLDRVATAVGDLYPDAEVLITALGSWGNGLNYLIPQAKGEYLSCCCDDTVPLPGCYEAGVAMLDSGSMPASRYLNPDGSPCQPAWDDAPHGQPIAWCRSFLLTRDLYEKVGPFIDATWYADWDYSERLIAAGVPIVTCDGFSFTHLDGPRGWLTPTEDSRQRGEYEASHRRQGIA